jgi:hypothetical protein
VFFKVAERQNFSAVWLFVYLMFCFSFQISNQKLSELIIIFCGIALFYVPMWIRGAFGNKGS